MIASMGKATRVKGPRGERMARRRTVADNPATALNRALLERGWVEHRFPNSPPGEWVDWFPSEPHWGFPPSLIVSSDRSSGDIDVVGQTAIGITGDAGSDGFLYNMDIYVEFMPDPAFACDLHRPPQARSFPDTHDGVAALIAQLDDIEAPVVDAAEILNCPDCFPRTTR